MFCPVQFFLCACEEVIYSIYLTEVTDLSSQEEN